MSQDTNTQTGGEQQQELRGTCPYCLRSIDVYLDMKKRPYWTCLPCGTRTFATRAALDTMKATGWIWEDERPLEALKAWLKRVAEAAGFTTDKEKS
jgi:predicted phosphoadenosine phosphosulfate sulfurtransferase